MHKLLSSTYIYFIYAYFTESFIIQSHPNLSHNFISKYNNNYNLQSNKFIINARKSKSELIVGGDVEEEPSIVKDVQTEESKAFADKCWEKKLSIKEALNLINEEPEKVDDSVLNRLLFENSMESDDAVDKDPEDSKHSQKSTPKTTTSEKIEDVPVGTVDLDPIYEDELDELEDDDEEDEEYFLEVDFSLLTNIEISLILSIMREKINNPDTDYKPKIIKLALEHKDLNCNEKNVEKKIKKMDEIADLFLNLNRNLGRELLNLDWIPELETSTFKFLKRKRYTLARITWIEDSLMVLLREKNLPEKEVMDIQEKLTEHIQELSMSREFKGVSNLGILVSGNDP